MSRSSSLIVRNTMIYAMGDIIPRLFSFISFPILTTYLLPSDYGIVNYVFTINNFISIISILSLNTYYMVYYFKTEGDELKRKLLGNLDLFIIGLNFIIVSIFFVVGPSFMRLWGSKIDFYPYMAIGLGISFFGIFRYLPSALFRVQERPLPLTILNVAMGFLSTAASILAVVFIKADASSVLWSSLMVTFVSAVIFFIITNKNAIWNINFKQIKSALAFSLPLVPASIATYLYSTFDRILIEKHLTLTDVGLYSTAATLALMLNLVTHGAYQAFEPYFFKTYKTPSFKENFITVRDVLLCVSLIGYMCLSCFGKEFFILFSAEKYHICYIYVPIISMGAVVAAMNRMYITIVTAREKTKISAAVTILGGVVSVTMNYFLLPILGVWAAALSYLTTFCVVFVLNMHYSQVVIKHGRALLSIFIVAIATCIITYLVQIDNIWMSIFVKCLLVAAISLVIIRILKVDVRFFLSSIFKKQ